MMGSKLSETVGSTVTVGEVDLLEATAALSDGVKAERFTFCIGEVVFEQPNDPNLGVWKMYPENQLEHWIFRWW